MINKYHYAKNNAAYQEELIVGKLKRKWPLHLGMHEVQPNFENFMPLINKVSEKWEWNRQSRYNDGTLEEKLAHPETRLFELYDHGKTVGYTLITSPASKVKERFWGANDTTVIEIENLGLFPGCEGGGRGKTYFEMCFDLLFKKYDVVYWSQNDVHAPTLSQYYQEKLGMKLLATDQVEDFRKKATEKIA